MSLVKTHIAIPPDRYSVARLATAHLATRIYPYTLVWPLPRPWSETMVQKTTKDPEIIQQIVLGPQAHLFFAHQKRRIFLFSCEATPSRTIPKTQPLQVAFSLLERVDLRSHKRGILGKKCFWGRVGYPRVRKILVRDSGAGNGCANFTGA